MGGLATSRVASRILLIALTVWAVGQIIPSLLVPLGAIGFVADNDGVIFDLQGPFEYASSSPAAAVNLRKGDRLDLRTMNCWNPDTPVCTSVIAVLGGMGGPQRVAVDKKLTFTVLSSNQSAHTVDIVARPVPGRIVQLVDDVLGIAVLLAAALLVWIRPGPMLWGFFLFLVWFNPGEGYGYFVLLQDYPRLLLASLTVNAVLFGASLAGFLIFVLRAPTDQYAPFRRPGLLTALVIVVGAGFCAFQLAAMGNMFGRGTELTNRLGWIAVFLLAAVVVPWILYLRYRRLFPSNRQRLRWVIFGSVFGPPFYPLTLLLSATSIWPANIFGIFRPEDVGDVLALQAGLFTLFVWLVAIHRHAARIVDLLPVVGAFQLVFVIIPLALAHHWVEHLLEHLSDLFPTLFVLVAVVGVAILVRYTHTWLEHLIGHIYSLAFRPYLARLKKCEARLRRAKRKSGIDRLLIRAPRWAFGIVSVAVFRLEGNGRLVRTATGESGWSRAASVLDVKDPTLSRLVPAGGAQPETWVGLQATDVSRLRLPCTPLATPLLALRVGTGAQLFAIAFYGVRRNGGALPAADRTALEELAIAAADGYPVAS
jgi:hypothetical protein